jgi:RNA polymerase sigma factor (sigma-70 family)
MFEILSGFALVVFRGTAIDLGDPHERKIDMYHTETAAVDVTGACARVAPLPSARRDLPDATLIAQIATGDRFAMHALFCGAMLRQCLGALSPEHRTIIDLVYYHEKSVQEVAAIVGIPRATVKTRMFYARKKLSALLAAQGVTRAAV